MCSRFGKFALLGAIASLLATTCNAGSISWTNYNVVSLGNFNESGQDVEGTVFVGGNFSSPNGSQIASNFNVTYPKTQDTLSVVGNISTNNPGNIHIQQGSVLYGGTLSPAPSNGNSGPFGMNSGGTFTHDTQGVLSGQLAILSSQISAATTAFSAMASNSNVVVSGNTATFNAVANTHGVAVFDISASLFSNSSLASFILNLGNGVTSVVIDVTQPTHGQSTTINFSSALHFNSFQSDNANVMWNFGTGYSAINLQNEFEGSILAPDATVTTGNTPVEGSIFANVINANGEIHLPYYAGVDPVSSVPEPSAIVLASIGIFFAGLYQWSRKRPMFNRLIG